MKKTVLLLLLLLLSSVVFSQNYIPLDTTDYAKRVALIKDIEANKLALEKEIKKNYKSKIRKEITNSYSGLFDRI